MGFILKTVIVLAALAAQFGLSGGWLDLRTASLAAVALAIAYVTASLIRFDGDPTAGKRELRAGIGAAAVALVALYPAARSLLPSVDILKLLLLAIMIALIASRYRKLRRMARLEARIARNEFDRILGKCLQLLPDVAQARLTASDIMMWKHLFGRVSSFDNGAEAVFALSHGEGKAAGYRRIALSGALLVVASVGLSFLSLTAAIIVGIILGYSLLLKIAQLRSTRTARIAVYSEEVIIIDGHFAYVMVPRNEIFGVATIPANHPVSSAHGQTLVAGAAEANLLMLFERPQAVFLPLGLSKDYGAVLAGLSASDCQSLERMLEVRRPIVSASRPSVAADYVNTAPMSVAGKDSALKTR